MLYLSNAPLKLNASAVFCHSSQAQSKYNNLIHAWRKETISLLYVMKSGEIRRKLQNNILKNGLK